MNITTYIQSRIDILNKHKYKNKWLTEVGEAQCQGRLDELRLIQEQLNKEGLELGCTRDDNSKRWDVEPRIELATGSEE